MYSVVGKTNKTLSPSRRQLIVLLHRLKLGRNQTTVNTATFESPLCAQLCYSRLVTPTTSRASCASMPASPSASPSSTKLYSEIDEAYRRLPWVIASKFIPPFTSTPTSDGSCPQMESLFKTPDVDITSPEFVETLSHYQDIRRQRLLKEAQVRNQQLSVDFGPSPTVHTHLYDRSQATIIELNETLQRVPFLPEGLISILNNTSEISICPEHNP